jgi:hypothetical protein
MDFASEGAAQVATHRLVLLRCRWLRAVVTEEPRPSQLLYLTEEWARLWIDARSTQETSAGANPEKAEERLAKL